MVTGGDPQDLRQQPLKAGYDWGAQTPLCVSKQTHEQCCSFCLDSHTYQLTVEPPHQSDAMNSWIPVPPSDSLISDLPSSHSEAAGNNIDPMEVYFECITTCSLDDGECITSCTEVFRQNH